MIMIQEKHDAAPIMPLLTFTVYVDHDKGGANMKRCCHRIVAALRCIGGVSMLSIATDKPAEARLLDV